MLCLSWKIHGYINVYRHPTTTHTSYVCNALEFYTMEYPRCKLDFHSIHTVFKLIVHICKENTCTCDLWVISCYNNNDNYYLTNLVFLVCTASYESLFFLNIDLWPMRFVLGP